MLLERGGVRVGVIGVTTEETLTTTIAANVRDLAVEPLAQAIAREADALRARGAAVVLVAAHAGGRCEAFEDARDLSSCRPDEEIFRVARALPERAVDAVVAGHTHAGVAHLVNGIPIIESFSYGRAFGRVDLVVEPSRGVVDVIVHAPRELCEQGSADGGDCAPGTYEGRAVSPDPRVADTLAPALENARALRERPLGVVLEGAFGASCGGESPLGNLVTDLMRAARPSADVAVTNGGGLRADLPAGPLTYGALYEACPFDNQFALVRLSAAELSAVLAASLAGRGGFLSIGGLRAEARCESGALRVSLRDEHGRAIDERRELTVVTTDFLATSGALSVPAERVTIEEGRFVREAMAGVLAERGGRLSPVAAPHPRAPARALRGRASAHLPVTRFALAEPPRRRRRAPARLASPRERARSSGHPVSPPRRLQRLAAAGGRRRRGRGLGRGLRLHRRVRLAGVCARRRRGPAHHAVGGRRARVQRGPRAALPLVLPLRGELDLLPHRAAGDGHLEQRRRWVRQRLGHRVPGRHAAVSCLAGLVDHLRVVPPGRGRLGHLQRDLRR
ncbi:MAG: 5'-nucleotidase C-terminal domain-containing protein [Sandaracinaceae bacterium]|nr:5'-nucleotidase C-terminal domain-containing protein [Sandaracinaceae bacterium]